MLYRNDDPRAILAMEEARTGNYGEDGYYDRPNQCCPVCEIENPDYFYKNCYTDEIVGCSECIYKEYYNL